jgi:hypothetical protein
MFVRNLRNHEIKVKYKVFNQGPKTESVPAGKIVEIPTLTAVSQVIFNSYDQRLRDLDTKFPDRNVDHLIEFRNEFFISGATL